MRVVSLLPSATEILFGIGAGHLVVGVTHECDYPPEAAHLPHLTSSTLPPDLQTHPGTAGPGGEHVARKIDRHVRADVHAGSSLYALDAELLERLEPDLIVTQELCAVCAVSYDVVARAAKRLRSDPRVLSLEPSSLGDVIETIATVGELVGHERGAQALIQGLRTRIDRLRHAAAALAEPPRTLVLEWTDPPMSAGHWTPELVELAGGVPVLANPGTNSATLAWGDIAAADPDAVIVAPCGFDLSRTAQAIAELAAVPEWSALRAVREQRVYPVDGSAYVNRPGPRLVDSAEIFADRLQPRRQTSRATPY